MYRYEKANEIDDYYIIYDPEGDFVCTVLSLPDAEALISHLNRTQ